MEQWEEFAGEMKWPMLKAGLGLAAEWGGPHCRDASQMLCLLSRLQAGRGYHVATLRCVKRCCRPYAGGTTRPVGAKWLSCRFENMQKYMGYHWS